MDVTFEEFDRLDSAAFELMMLVDSARVIASEMGEKFFDPFDARSQEGMKSILLAYDRNRAKFNALQLLLREMNRTLKNAGYTRQRTRAQNPTQKA